MIAYLKSLLKRSSRPCCSSCASGSRDEHRMSPAPSSSFGVCSRMRIMIAVATTDENMQMYSMHALVYAHQLNSVAGGAAGVT